MFTRTKDRGNKIHYDLEVLAHNNNYTFSKPGNGTSLAYMKSPNIRLQQWGGNIRTNMTEIEHDLRGQTRKLNRDNIDANDYKKNEASSQPLVFENTSIKHSNTRTEENRCDVLDSCLKNSMKNFLYEDPQKNIRYTQPSSTRYDQKWKASTLVN
tara:strand:- start:398 stop:862 length:465 start_codon:yes stop_codon:yes gene_type:complete